MNVDELKNTIICGDCLETMRQLPDKCVDLIITDPPYEFISKTSTGGGFMTDANKVHLERISETFGMSYNPDDYLAECGRLLKKFNGYFFTNKSLLKDYIQFAEDNKFKWDILIWSKPNPVPIFKSHYLLDKEYIVYIRQTGAYFNSHLKYENYFTVKSHPIGTKKTKHPTEKPVSLLYDMIRVSSNPGDLVFDGYMGSGSTAVACLRTGRHYIGIDNNAEYVQQAIARIEEEKYKDAMFMPTDATVQLTMKY